MFTKRAQLAPRPAAPSGKIWNRQFICVFLANAMLYLGLYMVQTLVTKYADSLGATERQIGLVASAFAVTALLIKTVSGTIIDSFRKENVLRFALIFMIIAFGGYSVSRSVEAIIVFRLFQGVAQAFTAACYLSLATEYLPPEKIGTGIGIFTLAQASSQAVAPAVGLWIAERGTLRTTFLCAAVILALSFFMTFSVRTDPPAQRRKLRFSLRNMVAREAILPASLQALLVCCSSLINSHLVLYATQRGVGGIGSYFTVYAGAMLITRPLLGKLSDRFGSTRVLAPALLCFAASFWLISAAESLPLFLLAAFVGAFGFGAASPVINTLCVKSVPPERRGLASTTSYIGFDLGNLIGPILAAPVIEAFGYSCMWRIMPVTIFWALAILLIFHKRFSRIDSDFAARSQAQD